MRSHTCEATKMSSRKATSRRAVLGKAVCCLPLRLGKQASPRERREAYRATGAHGGARSSTGGKRRRSMKIATVRPRDLPECWGMKIDEINMPGCSIDLDSIKNELNETTAQVHGELPAPDTLCRRTQQGGPTIQSEVQNYYPAIDDHCLTTAWYLPPRTLHHHQYHLSPSLYSAS